jgi:hypothetical protein
VREPSLEVWRKRDRSRGQDEPSTVRESESNTRLSGQRIGKQDCMGNAETDPPVLKH